MGQPAEIKLVTWFHADAKGKAGNYPQASGDSTSQSHFELYLRCVDVCVASFRRWNPTAPAMVVLNSLAAGVISANRRALWDGWGVDVRTTENYHAAQTDLWAQWQNQFFLLDVMQEARQGSAPSDPLLVLDSDCLVRCDLSVLAAETRAQGRVAMEIPYPENQQVNGLSRRELHGVVTDWRGADQSFVPAYLGGEFLCLTAEAMGNLLADAEGFYQWSLERQRQGLPHPHEEAQLLSGAAPIASGQSTGDQYISRLWTQPWALRSLPASVQTLPLWHLPGEKKTGIRRLHGPATDVKSWFWTSPADRWQQRTGRAVGIPGYRPSKAASDAALLAPLAGRALRRRLSRG